MLKINSFASVRELKVHYCADCKNIKSKRLKSMVYIHQSIPMTEHQGPMTERTAGKAGPDHWNNVQKGFSTFYVFFIADGWANIISLL